MRVSELPPGTELPGLDSLIAPDGTRWLAYNAYSDVDPDRVLEKFQLTKFKYVDGNDLVNHRPSLVIGERARIYKSPFWIFQSAKDARFHWTMAMPETAVTREQVKRAYSMNPSWRPDPGRQFVILYYDLIKLQNEFGAIAL